MIKVMILKLMTRLRILHAGVCEEKLDGGVKQGSVISRKIMIVIDSNFEAKSSLQWALTHTVQNHDTIVLLHVIKSSKQGVCENSSLDKFLFGVVSSIQLIIQSFNLLNLYYYFFCFQ
jgi:hypothetical protein